MKYAVIRTGGKQYKISEGDVIEVERLQDGTGKTVTFNEVLLYMADGIAKIGQPLVNEVVVTGKILEDFKGDKIRVAKYKAKVRYRRVAGHRQALSRIQIESIGSPTKVKAEKKTEDEATAKKAGKEEK